MPTISVRVSAAERHILVVIARQHGGNLTDAFRSLLQKESIMEELRKEFRPLTEVQEKRAVEHEEHAEILDKAVASLLESQKRNTDSLTSLRDGVRRIVQHLESKK